MITTKWLLGASDPDFEIIKAMRRAVFVEGQGAQNSAVLDKHDEYAVHALVCLDGTPCASGRLYHDGVSARIGRILTLEEYRGKGVGDLTIRLLLYKASTTATPAIDMYAQTYVWEIYQKFGFKRLSDEVIQDIGLPHYALHLDMTDLQFPSKCHKD